MKDSMLEVGKVLNTHGIRGELKVQSWCDTPEDLCQLETVYIGQRPYSVRQGRVHGSFALLTLEGIDSIDLALPLKNKILLASREALALEEGAHFVVDLIGLEARDFETGAVFGTVTDVLEYPAHDLYAVQGERSYLIPDVPAFVKEVAPEKGYISFVLLEGMAQ